MPSRSQSVRIGLIGTSWWADLAHLPFIKAEPRAALVAICGRDRARAQAMADKYAVPDVYTDYREMIARAGLDAIVVATPDDEHLPMTLAAIEAGLHVICEKPLANSAADAKRMLDAAQAKGVRHLVFHTWRWQPAYRHMRALIDQGVLGRLVQAEFRFLMGGGPATDYAWRFDRAHAAGVTGDNGAHLFDLARYLCGEVAEVNADIGNAAWRTKPDGAHFLQAGDLATIQMQFVSGARGLVNLSMAARTEDKSFEQAVLLHGERASLTANWSSQTGIALRLAQGGSGTYQPVPLPEPLLHGIDPSRPFLESFGSMFASQPIGIRLFVDGILNGKNGEPNFYDGWKTQQVIDAAIQSGDARRWVKVGEGN